ncbi:DUF3427 domain-containing protein [Gracilibacillus kekensis]|uniref:Superfamily II DNA or RNA helicase n=1 Tax=Gracilibacillus kekensis TaxID=1027249 RepID=A0A1M7LEA1_9BACI|nr:DEAD/DEAH box helicase [Gracilibacillus kekensis]SHM76265.1 Superfamily II DNA or RNA helicase [Gracilibacillus kekensis]
MSNLINKLQQSYHKGLIDKYSNYNGKFKPELLLNNEQKKQNVLTSLIDELKNCQSFLFSVAFITESGLATLKSHLLDLHNKGVKGSILTSTYQYFNQPKIFRELLKLKNVDVRISDVEGFHSKGYIFQHEDYATLIVGSSNLSAHALQVNYEWNIKLTSHDNGELLDYFQMQFNELWNTSTPLTNEWINQYQETWEQLQPQKVAEMPSSYNSNKVENALTIEPNSMQVQALKGIEAIRNQNQDRALIISATGTGKTYLAAFDVRTVRPERMLFIVHREQILQKAKQDFMQLLGGNENDFGILSGSSKQIDRKYVFATVQTISKEDTLQQLDKDLFDYILIDESHRAGATSYQRIIDHFKPEFLLGMTATPERTDGYDLFKLFDYNIAYEIRLQEALEEDMLVPFHYYGVTDLEIDGEVKDVTTFNQLISDERVTRIIEKIDYYSHSSDKVRGLMFCSTKKEAKALSEHFNHRGIKTVALTGDDLQEVRQYQVNRLENGELDYIITVDIFNEGIDIPAINQVVMLRQTDSSIIFIQQLGRGLRKHATKEYLTVIDFIGNYQNNFLIPIALSGDNSQNKDSIRRKMIDTSYIKGTSTINFEAVAKERIYQSIQTANLMHMKVLKDAYQTLKMRIGRIPLLRDFYDHNSIDPTVIVDKKDNMLDFLQAMKEEVEAIPKHAQQILTFISKEVLPGKRKHEIILLQSLVKSGSLSKNTFIDMLVSKGLPVDDQTIQSIERICGLDFYTEADRKKYGNEPIVEVSGEGYTLCEKGKQYLNQSWFVQLIEDALYVAEKRSERFESKGSLKRLEKYSRKDVCKYLNWENDEHSTMYGYKTKHQTCPIFVTYHKKDDVEESVNYEDTFKSPEVLHWYTRSRRRKTSQEVIDIIEAEEKGIDIHVFVKKDDDEGNDFYYLGEAIPDQSSVEETKMAGKNGEELPVVTMDLHLQESVDQAIYDYLHEDIG